MNTYGPILSFIKYNTMPDFLLLLFLFQLSIINTTSVPSGLLSFIILSLLPSVVFHKSSVFILIHVFIFHYMLVYL